MNKRLAPWEDGSRYKLPGLRVPALKLDSLRPNAGRTPSSGSQSARALAKITQGGNQSIAHTARDELLSFVKYNPSPPDHADEIPVMPSERSRYARSLKLPKTSDSASVPRSTGESGQIVPRALSSWGSVKQTPRAEYRLRTRFGRRRFARTGGDGEGTGFRNNLVCPLIFMDMPELASDFSNGYVLMSVAATTTELLSVRIRDSIGAPRLLTFNLRQRIREKGYAGDLVVYKYEFQELLRSSFDPPWKKIVMRRGKEVEWTKEMKRYTFWDFKGQALDLELIPNLGGVLSDDSDADSELGLLREAHGKLPISEQDMLTDKRMYRSHAAQIAEMNHYLTRLNMESAEDLNNLIILPQILLSLRHADHWGPAPGAIKHKRPDFEGLILVSLHYLFLKHAQVRGTLDEVRLSFTEIEAALEDEFFWGQSQICEYFTVDDLAWMCRGEATFSWSQFPALLQDIRLLTRQRVELVDRMNTITDNIDDDIARHKSSDAMDGIEHLKEVADAMLDSMVHGEENLKPAVIQLSKTQNVISLVQAEENKVHRLNSDAKHHYDLYTSLQVLFASYIKSALSQQDGPEPFVPFMVILHAAVHRRIHARQVSARELLVAVEKVVHASVTEGDKITDDFIRALQALDLPAANKAWERFAKLKERFMNRMKPPKLIHLLASFKFSDSVSPAVEEHLMDCKLANAEEEVTRNFFEEWTRVQRKSMPYTWLLMRLFETQLQKFSASMEAVKRDIMQYEEESLQGDNSNKASDVEVPKERNKKETTSTPSTPSRTSFRVAFGDERSFLGSSRAETSSAGSPNSPKEVHMGDQRLEDMLSADLCEPILHKLACFKECIQLVARAYVLLRSGQLQDCIQVITQCADLAGGEAINDIGSLSACLAKVRQQLVVTRIGMAAHTAAAAVLATASQQDKRPDFSGKGLLQHMGMLSDETLKACKAMLRGGGGWRLSTEPVRKMMKLVREQKRELLAHIVMCEELGSEYSWSMLVLDLGNLSHHLLLNDNRLTRIPVQVFEHLAQLPLHTLNLSCNELEDIPPTIDSLTALKYLHLDSNRLAKLPVNLGNLLSTLQEVTLSDNLPFENPPQEIVALGGMDAVEFLKGIFDQGVPNNQMELILVGQPLSGKTSTQQAIVNDDAQVAERVSDPRKQVGISSTEWTPKTPSAEGLSFVILDIGGQSLYSTLHQYLLSRRAVYGLVWRLARLQNSNESSIEYKDEMERVAAPVLTWMQDLQLRVPGAFVVLIATHSDCASAISVGKQIKAVKTAVNEMLKRQQTTIDDHISCGNKTHIRPLQVWNQGESIPIDCLKGEGVATCREALIAQAKRMPLFGEVIPASYLRVRDRLRKMRRSPTSNGRPWLSWKAFREILLVCGVCPSQSKHDIFDYAVDHHPKTKARHSAKQAVWLAKQIRRMSVERETGNNGSESLIVRLQSEQGGLPDADVPPEEPTEEEAMPSRFKRGEKHICYLQAAVKRVHDRFEFLHNRRLHHRERMHCEMNVAMSFLHDTGEIRFFGIVALKEMFALRQRKAMLQDRLFQLHGRKFLTAGHEVEQTQITQEVEQLSEQWKLLRRSFRESILLSTVYVDPGWALDVMKGLINHNLPRLYSYFKKQNGPQAEKMTLMVKEMATRGIVNAALFPYLWPATAESKEYWKLVRASDLEIDQWPYDVVVETGSTKDVAVHARIVALLGAFDIILRKENNTLVAPCLLSEARCSSMPSQAFSDHHSPLCCHLVYDGLPDGYLQRLVVRCSRLALHVDFSKTMATFYNRGQKALVSVIRVKDPSANLPKHLFEGITTGWSVSKWKSEESRKALVRKAGGTRLRGSELDAAISKTFHAFDSAAHARDGALTLSKEQVLTGMQNLGVRLSEQEIDKLFEEADTDHSSELDEFEFSDLVKTLFRKSEISHLRHDQTHVVLKCSTHAQQRAFLDAIDDLEKGFPGLLRVALIEPNEGTEEVPCEVTFCRAPESSAPVFAVQRINKAYTIVDWSDEARRLFGGDLTVNSIVNRNMMELVHPIVKFKVESCLQKCSAIIQVNGIGKEEWVTCGLQFKSIKSTSNRRLSVASAVSSDGGGGGYATFPVKGVLMKRNHDDEDKSPRHGQHHWRERVYELYQDGNLMYYSAKMQGYSTWNVSNCKLGDLDEEHKVGLSQDYLPFRLTFEDGRVLDFAALSEMEYLRWVDALQAVCSLALVPVDMIPRCVDPENGTWKIQVYSNLISTIKYQLDQRGISYEDNVHPEKTAGSSPRAAVCFIEDKFFNSKHCARNFANYVAHRMSIIPLIMPQYKFPKDIHGKPNFSRWWKGEDRWEKWKDYALFINMQKDPKQERQVKEILIPTIESHLEQWRGDAPGDKENASDDRIPCVKCVEVGLRDKGEWLRLELIEKLKIWRFEEQLRRGKNLDPTQEPLLKCDKCSHVSHVSDCLSMGTLVESIPCPSCAAETLVPPYCFSRQQCQMELRNSDKAGTAVMFCPLEKKTIRVLDILVPECFISYHWGDRISDDSGQEYFVFQERIQQMRLYVEDEASVVCWLDVAGGMKAGDNMLHAMKHGVKKSIVFLMFVNDDYVRSHNCIREFSYAVENSKYIIPVLTQPYHRLRGKQVTDEQWWPDDAKHPDGGVAPWSILQNFEPIDLRKPVNEGRGKAEIVKRILSRFRKTIADDQELKRDYQGWRKQVPKLIDPRVGKEAFENKIRESFHELDKDQSGTLDVIELSSALETFGISLNTNSGEEANELLAEADINGDGKIDLPEFMVMMTAIFSMEDDFLLDPQGQSLNRRLLSKAALKRAIAVTKTAVALQSSKRPHSAQG